MMNRKIHVLAILFTLILVSASAGAAENNVTLYYFWGDGCPHCAEAKPFFDGLQAKYPWLEVKNYETWKNPDNSELFVRAMDALGENAQGVPTIIVGGKSFVGYGSASTTGAQIEARILECRENYCPDPLERIVSCCVHLFIQTGCEHCERIKPFIDEMEAKYDLHLVRHDVVEPGERAVLEQFRNSYGVEIIGFPAVFIGDKYFVGENIVRDNLEAELIKCSAEGYTCPAENAGLVCNTLGSSSLSPSMPSHKDFTPEEDWIIDLPLFGRVDASKKSLLTLSIMIGLLDGFNPCAMWVLTFLLTLLVYTRSRRKMMVVGGTFLIVSAIAYFLFMTAWLNLFLYVGFLPGLRLAVGVGALAAGLLNLKDFVWFGKGLSIGISRERRKGLIRRMRDVIHAGAWPSIIAGTVFLAVTVNFIELLCTAGLPALFTRILTLNQLSTVSYYFYMGVYILMYMLDDMAIFTIAVYTLSSKKITKNEGKWLKLVSGLLMAVLGLILIIKPEALMFT